MEQKAISKLGSFGKLLFQSMASVISERGRDSYFKVGQSLFQSGAVTSQKGTMLFQSAELFENGAIISKWGIKTTFADIDSFFKNITVSLKKATLQKKFLWSNKN